MIRLTGVWGALGTEITGRDYVTPSHRPEPHGNSLSVLMEYPPKRYGEAVKARPR